MGVLEQPASETSVHSVMKIRWLRFGDTIITSYTGYTKNLNIILDGLIFLQKPVFELHGCLQHGHWKAWKASANIYIRNTV